MKKHRERDRERHRERDREATSPFAGTTRHDRRIATATSESFTDSDLASDTSSDVEIDRNLHYVHLVRKRFADQPGIFSTFSRLLSDISQPGVDKIDIVMDIVKLFADHRDLIDMFLRWFAPEVSWADTTGSILVLHMQHRKLVGMETKQRAETFESDLYASADVRRNRKSDASAYIRRIRTVCDGDTYRQFLLIVQSYCAQQTSDVDTIHRIVILFWKHPELVVGFQRFLPTGCKIVQRDKYLYVLRYPGPDKRRSLYFMVDDNFDK